MHNKGRNQERQRCHEKDIASNVKSSPKKCRSYTKRKASYKQGISHRQISVSNDEGKIILTTSDLDKTQGLSNILKSVLMVENSPNITQWA